MLDNSGGLPHPVATRAANRWGLYDMTGNTWEWTLDAWYVYQNVEATDPWESLPEEVPLEEGELIIRGGGANTLRREGTVYHRLSFDTTHAFFADQGDAGDLNPENPFNHFGFRLVRNAP
jgi:formylglycine-generating enzyme required for sulfatase activity